MQLALVVVDVQIPFVFTAPMLSEAILKFMTGSVTINWMPYVPGVPELNVGLLIAELEKVPVAGIGDTWDHA